MTCGMRQAASETERGRVTDTRGETTTTGAGKISRRTIKIASVTVNSARDSPVWADSGDSKEKFSSHKPARGSGKQDRD